MTYHFKLVLHIDLMDAVRQTKVICERIGFSNIAALEVATAVSELGSNILKYAKLGFITVSEIKRVGYYGIEVIAEDEGPGIHDIDVAFTEHMSTSDTLGIGLPAIKRLMDDVQIDSVVGIGTKIIARKWEAVDA